MSPPADAILLVWEQGRQRHPLDRALLLYALAEPEAQHDGLADRTLGQRNRALLRLRRALFGDVLSAALACPRCSERLELELRVSELLSGVDAVPEDIELDGMRFRMPTTRDLAAIAGQADTEGAELSLLALLSTAGATHHEGALVTLSSRLELALEAADPHTDLTLGVSCVACQQAWSARFDVASFVWDELDVHARRLLDEVHCLARAYGWSEGEILALSDTRRAAYLERALA